MRTLIIIMVMAVSSCQSHGNKIHEILINEKIVTGYDLYKTSPEELLTDVSTRTSLIQAGIHSPAGADLFFDSYYLFTKETCEKSVENYNDKFDSVYNTYNQVHTFIQSIIRPGSYHESKRLRGRINWQLLNATTLLKKDPIGVSKKLSQRVEEYLEIRYRIEGPEDVKRKHDLMGLIQNILKSYKKAAAMLSANEKVLFDAYLEKHLPSGNK